MVFYFIIKNKIIVLAGRSIELGWGVIILSKITQNISSLLTYEESKSIYYTEIYIMEIEELYGRRGPNHSVRQGNGGNYKVRIDI